MKVMSGIAGVWNLDGRPAEGPVLGAMSAALAHRGPDALGERLEGAVGLACRHLWVTPEEVGERQPLASPGGALLVMDGRLDNRDELRAALGRPAGDSDARLALAAYDRWGTECAERLNGDFAIAVFDPGHQRLLLARDAIGVRPLCYHHHPGRVIGFGSEIKALFALPGFRAEADLDGLADCLLLGHRPLDRQDVTCFRGVQALPPAHVAVITPQRITIRRYWDFDRGATVRLRAFSDYVEAFHDVFGKAVRRRARAAAPVAVSVSGGLDSSSILSQIEWDRRRGVAASPAVAAVSYTGAEGSDADEARYLVDLEREHGIRVARIPMEAHLGLVRGADDQARAAESPFLDYLWGVTEATHHAMRVAGARVVLSGHWGDQVLFSAAYLVDLFRQGRWGDIWRHTREYQRWFGLEEARTWRSRFLFDLVRHHTPRAVVPPLKWVRRHLNGDARVAPWFSRSFRAVGLRYANRVADVGNGFHSAHARAVYLEARSKYHVLCLEWNNKSGAAFGMDSAFPFLDRDLVAFLMAIPGDMLCHQGVPRALLREAMRGVLPAPVRARTWKADFSAPVNQGVLQDMAQIAAALTADAAAVRLGILDGTRLASEVRRLAADLSGPDCVESWDLADLFGLETWTRVFLDVGDGGRSTLRRSA